MFESVHLRHRFVGVGMVAPKWYCVIRSYVVFCCCCRYVGSGGSGTMLLVVYRFFVVYMALSPLVYRVIRDEL